MTRVLLDETTLGKLGHFKECLEACDASGRVLGYITPAVDPELYGNVKVPFTEEELDRFEREPGGRSLAEILAELEKKS